MVIPTILYPVIAFGLAIGVGRIGTIVKDAMRVDFTTEMDDSIGSAFLDIFFAPVVLMFANPLIPKYASRQLGFT